LADTIVSVRVPSSIIKELRILAEKNHYMDISEEVRSIARDNWLKSQNPVLHELKILKNEITRNVKSKKQENLIDEIHKVKAEIAEMIEGKMKNETKLKRSKSKEDNFIEEIE